MTTSAKAYRFEQLSVRNVIDRATELMNHCACLQMNDEVMMQLAINMQRDGMSTDPWEALSWHMVEMECFERLTRASDKSVEMHPRGFNGGF